MEQLLAAYAPEVKAPPKSDFSISVNLAPTVKEKAKVEAYVDPVSKQIVHNPRYEVLYAPVQGPKNLFATEDSLLPNSNNTLTGHVQAEHLNDYIFEKEFYKFSGRGYAADPSGSYKTDHQINYIGEKKPTKAPVSKKRRRKRKGDPESDDFLGPWAPYKEEPEVRVLTAEEIAEADRIMPKGKRRKKREMEAELAAEQERMEEEEENPPAEEEGEKEKEKTEGMVEEEEEEEEELEQSEGTETSTFHGTELYDYQGRSYLSAPSHLRNFPHKTFLPKKVVHTWKAHPKGVNAVRLFPKFGHIMLSAGMDGCIKLWDMYDKKNLLRTFNGHTKSVRDLCWNSDGSKFLSCSYDKQIKLWDTETGVCLGRYSNRNIPYCVKFHPHPDKENQFLVGCSNKKIVQWDTNTGKITQQYDQHLGPVNTITFIDEGRRFVTSSDDKSLRIWEFGIPVVIKYICEPHMHSMPSVKVHPNGNWFVAQSLDNQILVYSTRDRFRMNKKKRFLGHLIAGFACQVNFSPDGKYLISGDSDGKLWIWDWKHSKVLRTLQGHRKCVIGCEWHPIEPSKVVTCSWDGTIKYWD